MQPLVLSANLGGLYASPFNEVFEFDSNRFTLNSADDCGGAVNIVSDMIDFFNCTFYDNRGAKGVSYNARLNVLNICLLSHRVVFVSMVKNLLFESV